MKKRLNFTKRLLQISGMTQKEFAVGIGYRQSTICEAAMTNRRFTVDYLLKAQALTRIPWEQTMNFVVDHYDGLEKPKTGPREPKSGPLEPHVRLAKVMKSAETRKKRKEGEK